MDCALTVNDNGIKKWLYSSQLTMSCHFPRVIDKFCWFSIEKRFTINEWFYGRYGIGEEEQHKGPLLLSMPDMVTVKEPLIRHELFWEKWRTQTMSALISQALCYYERSTLHTRMLWISVFGLSVRARKAPVRPAAVVILNNDELTFKKKELIIRRSISFTVNSPRSSPWWSRLSLPSKR